MKSTLLLAACFMLLPFMASASFFDDESAPDCVTATGATFEPTFSSATVAVSPAIVKAIASAKKSIRVAAHDFISKPVSEAIVKAARSQIDVKVILDRSTSSNPASAAQFLATMSMPPNVTKTNSALYTDYIVIDEKDVVLGNSLQAADIEEEKKNSYNVLIIRNSPDLAKHYLGQWQMLWKNSEILPKDKQSKKD